MTAHRIPSGNLFAMTTDSTTQPTDAATPNAPATKPAKASKKTTGDVNKSDEIRKLATASGDGQRPWPVIRS